MAEVYAICFPNGKLYVGWTAKTAIRRFAGHLRAVRQGSTYAVHNALRKYGPDAVVLATLHSNITPDKAKELEKFYIAEWDTRRPRGYNLTAGGDNVVDLDNESRAKISAGVKQAWLDPGYRSRISKATGDRFRGKSLEAEHRERIAAARTGMRFSRATCNKIAEAKRGENLSKKTRLKMAAAQKLRCTDPEEKARRTARLNSPEARRKSADSRCGKSLSAETRAKMVATGRRLWQDPEYRARILEARRAARSAKGN